jgi:two-component system, chemotaxis family, protein-glutamate methylesterase/glutaminase
MRVSSRKIRVLVVDDSALVRHVLTETLSAEPDLEVVGSAADPYAARDLILQLQPDVLTLDIEMPRMDGLTFLRKLMRYRPMPVLVISSLAQSSCAAALTALEEGAVEALGKPAGPYSVGDLRRTLADKIRAAAVSRIRVPRPQSETPAPAPAIPPVLLRENVVVAIGASTGGTEAIRKILEKLPENFPPTVITQHIPAGFSKPFADRLNSLCRMEVKQAEEGDELRPGRALLAPGGLHMLVRRMGNGYRAIVKDGPRVCYQRPSVDVLFSSVAAEAGRNSVGVILTGMGSDGANGLLEIHRKGASTIAQDEESCVVFGMPREAIRIGAASQVLPLDQIASAMVRLVSTQEREPAARLKA